MALCMMSTPKSLKTGWRASSSVRPVNTSTWSVWLLCQTCKYLYLVSVASLSDCKYLYLISVASLSDCKYLYLVSVASLSDLYYLYLVSVVSFSDL